MGDLEQGLTPEQQGLAPEQQGLLSEQQGLLPEAPEVSEIFDDDKKKGCKWLLGFLWLLCIFGIVGIFLYLFIRFMTTNL